MTEYLQLLVEFLPSSNIKMSWERLYQEAKRDSLSLDEFKKDMTDYLKRKVKRFRIEKGVVSIECYISGEVNELVKYFKIGKVTKQIPIDTLYNSWRNPYSSSRNIFINKLERYLISKSIPYFIFDDILFIKD